MSTRPSVNKRQREAQRKERQAEKAIRRDERRTKRNLPPGEAPVDENAAEGAPVELGEVAGEGGSAAAPPLADE